MRPGIRVVRGPDWKYVMQDGGEGHLGTVVEVSGAEGSSLPEKHALVLWDSGEKHQYRVGAGDAFDLLVYDNAPADVSHHCVCDECKEVGIEGLRWKCSTCDSYDLCNKCYTSDVHDLDHTFIRFDIRSSDGVPVPSRAASKDQKIRCVGIFTGATVCRGQDWKWGDQDGGEGQQGKVKEDGKQPFRKLVIVEWQCGRTADYRVGSNGKVDLKCITPASGGYYYKSHLPILGKTSVVESGEDGSFLELMQQLSSSMFNPLRGLELMSKMSGSASPMRHSEIRKGFRVVRGPDWKWKEQDNGDGHVGTVVKVIKLELQNRLSVKVIWDSGEDNIYRAGSEGCFDLLVYDSAPGGVKHLNVECDECHEKSITGTRWKCSECDNFDLCTQCYNDDKHDVTHSFLRIDKASSKPVPVPKRSASEKVQAKGIFPNTTVKRGKHWKWNELDGGDENVGSVVKIIKWTPETRRSGALVKWAQGPSIETVAHRMGHKGKVDLKYTKSEVGGSYYRAHLPVLGKREKIAAKFKVGDKVNIILDVEDVKKMQEDHGGWNDGMTKYMKKVGTIKKVDDFGVVTVKYDDDRKLVYNQDVLNQVWLNPAEQGKPGDLEQTVSSSSESKTVTPSENIDDSSDSRSTQPQCKICLTRDACVAFVPCGHLVSCPKCAEGVDKCPICRSEIKQWLRTYIQ